MKFRKQEETKMKKVLVGLMALMMVLAGMVFAMAETAQEIPEQPAATAEFPEIQYVLFLGTNDKDTNTPVFTQAETIDKVHAAADEMVDVFHQSSVLIQANPTRTEFYAPGN